MSSVNKIERIRKIHIAFMLLTLLYILLTSGKGAIQYAAILIMVPCWIGGFYSYRIIRNFSISLRREKPEFYEAYIVRGNHIMYYINPWTRASNQWIQPFSWNGVRPDIRNEIENPEVVAILSALLRYDKLIVLMFGIEFIWMVIFSILKVWKP